MYLILLAGMFAAVDFGVWFEQSFRRPAEKWGRCSGISIEKLARDQVLWEIGDRSRRRTAEKIVEGPIVGVIL